jgi:hypothetical protein
MIEALAADGPAADRTGKMELYGRLIDPWDLDVSRFLDDGSKRRRQRYRSAWKQLRRTFNPVELCTDLAKFLSLARLDVA